MSINPDTFICVTYWKPEREIDPVLKGYSDHNLRLHQRLERQVEDQQLEIKELKAKLAFFEDSCDKHRRHVNALDSLVAANISAAIKKAVWGE